MDSQDAIVQALNTISTSFIILLAVTFAAAGIFWWMFRKMSKQFDTLISVLTPEQRKKYEKLMGLPYYGDREATADDFEKESKRYPASSREPRTFIQWRVARHIENNRKDDELL